MTDSGTPGTPAPGAPAASAVSAAPAAPASAPANPAPTAIVVVSHSATLARGVVEIAEQMAPDVLFRAAGGMEDGGLGTSFDLVEASVNELLAVEGVTGVVLTADLGSAVMTAESVVEFFDGPGELVLADGPVVEGTVAGAVRAQLGGSAAEVAEAAAVREAGRVLEELGGFGAGGGADGAEADPNGEEDSDTPGGAQPGGALAGEEGEIVRELTLVNPQGLHARPAAVMARTAGGFDAKVEINGVDATSIIALMQLGTSRGSVIFVSASGPQAAEAMAAVEAAVADGLGESVEETA